MQDRDFPEIHENVFLSFKSQIQICENVLSWNAKNWKSVKLNSRENSIDDATR